MRGGAGGREVDAVGFFGVDFLDALLVFLRPVDAVEGDGLGLLGADAQVNAGLRGGHFFLRVDGAGAVARPDGGAPGGAHDVVGKVAGGADAAFGHFVGEPELEDGLAQQLGEQVALGAEGFPGHEQGGAGGAVAALEVHDEHFVGHLQCHADLAHHGNPEGVEGGVGTPWCGAFDAFAGEQVDGFAAFHLARPFAGVVDDGALGVFVVQGVEGVGVHRDEGGHEAGDDGGVEFGVGPAAKLLQRLQDGGDPGHSAHLAGAQGFEDVQDVAPPGGAAAHGDAVPGVGLRGRGAGVLAGNVDSDFFAGGGDDFDAVDEGGAVLRAAGVADAVGFDDLQGQPGTAPCPGDARGEHGAVARLQEGAEDQLLQAVEVELAGGVAVR